ncbi:hypothetical protein [uncultured Psychrobacter sp.]|uniref:hypothetical protein n=1 Tax=uncultured Psychrobacter sp. TaxID=259303 RepID=UPI003457F76F
MKFFKLTALALASSLVLAGCGSDGGSSSTTVSNNNGSTIPAKPPVNNNLSDLQQAKGLIDTAKQFILDNKAIKDAYEGASEILTEQQQARVSLTFDIAEGLREYMQEKSITRLDAADIVFLRDNGDLQEIYDQDLESDFYWDRFYDNKLTPSDDFLATLDANGKFKLSGTTLVNSEDYEYSYNPLTNNIDSIVTKDSFKITYDKFENALTSNTSTDNFKGRFGFNNITIGSGAKAVVFSSLSQGATVNAQFSDKVLINDEFDLDEVNAAGITVEKAVIKLGDVKLKANDSTIKANDLELAFLDMSHKRADGSLVVRTLPSTIKLTGQLIKEKPKTDMTISLNAVANENDIKNVIKVTQDGDIEEAAGKFVGIEIVMSLNGQVARKNTNITTSIPIDIQANLKRMSRKDVELQGLSANVDGKKLYVTGKTILDTTYNVSCKCTQLNITQNNAAVNLKFDVNNDFVKQDTSTGKIADITVNGKVLGQLLENNGTVSAKFVDNSFVPLG